jgi:hypothetical protein
MNVKTFFYNVLSDHQQNNNDNPILLYLFYPPPSFHPFVITYTYVYREWVLTETQWSLLSRRVATAYRLQRTGCSDHNIQIYTHTEKERKR